MPEKIDVNELGRSVDPKSLSDEQLVDALREGLADGGGKTIDPSLFARLVKSTGKGQLESVMSSDVRRPVLDAIFGEPPQVVHWHVTGAPDGGSDDYQTAMQHGVCEVSDQPTEEPRTELFMDGVQFLKIVTNNASPITLFMTRKIKVQGDLGFATALQKMFTIPTA